MFDHEFEKDIVLRIFDEVEAVRTQNGRRWAAPAQSSFIVD